MMTNLQLLGMVLSFAGCAIAFYDIITNKLKNKIWLIFLSLFLIFGGFYLQSEAKEFSVIIVFFLLASAIWFWIEILYEKLNKAPIDVSKTFRIRMIFFVCSTILYLIYEMILYPSMKLFLEHLKIFVNIPKLLSVIVTFCVVYALVILLFGLLYATLHYYLENSGFNSAHQLRLQDFFFFSAFNIAAQGHKDMAPNHWLVSLLSLIQLSLGVALLSIYLAGAFTFIVAP